MTSIAQKIIDTQIALDALGIYNLIEEAKKKAGTTVFSGGGGSSSVISGGGSSSIGGSVLGGTAGSVLFINPNDVLAQDNANFFYDTTTKRLGVGGDPNSAGGIYTLFNGETVVNVQGALAGLMAAGGTASFLGLACTTSAADVKISSLINFGGSLHFANINDAGAVAKLMATFDLTTGYLGINTTTPSSRLEVINGALDSIKSQGINTFTLSTTATGQGILSSQLTSNGTTESHTTYASVITNVGSKTAGTNIGYQSRITPSGTETSGHIDIGFAASDYAASGSTNAAYYVGSFWEYAFLSLEGDAVFNETGSTSTFRVESISNPNMLFVDSVNNAVGIGEGSPNAGSLHVSRTDDEAAINFSYNGALQQQWRWRTGTSATFFSMEDVNNTTFPFKLRSGALTDTLVANLTGVGIYIETPASTLHVNGSFGYKVRSVVFGDSPVTAGDESVILCDATGGNITITLPLAGDVTDRVYNIKKTDSSVNTITIDTPFGALIDGSATLVINIPNDSYQIVCDGVDWFII